MTINVNRKALVTVGATLTVILLLAVPVLASKTFQPVFQPKLEIEKTTRTINIDGYLDDEGWETASRTSNFVERHPGDNIEPGVDTEVLITYDSDNLYVAFVCVDDPNQIRATMCQRDQFHGDDAVTLLLDTYGDASWAYEFFVNPYGIQKDQLWTNITGEDTGYDLIWKSAAQITETGYQVEMAIPFSSIRFPDKEVQSWKIDFWRTHPRDSYRQYSWSAYDRSEQCWPCQWGTVDGISNVRPGKGIEILPAFVSNRYGGIDYDSPDLPFKREDIEGELSLGGKYAINSNITLEAAYNPDFSQIEADAGQIDVNTTVALFFPERRPFFQEGRDIFRTLFNSFYTRTINDPQFAAKLTGRTEKYRFGVLSAVDENTPYIVPFEEGSSSPINVGKSYVNVFRGIQNVGDYSQLGIIVNDRRFEAGGYNSVIALDHNFRLSRNYIFIGQYVYTSTEEPDKPSLGYNELYWRDFDDGKHTGLFDGESFEDFAFISEIRRNGRHWNFILDYNQVGKSYQTQTGFDPWNNQRNFYITNTYTIYPSKFFNRITGRLSTDGRWNFEGIRKWRHYSAEINTQMNFAQTFAGVIFNTGVERWFGTEFEDLWHLNINLNMRPTSQFSFYINYNFGVGPAFSAGTKGNEKSLSAGFDLKPIDRLIIEPDINYLISNHKENGTELFENTIARTRVRYQATKSLSFRFVVEYSFREILSDYDSYINQSTYPREDYVLTRKGWNFEPLITYKINPFTVFYLGSTYIYNTYDNYDNLTPMYYLTPDWRPSTQQYFMKLQYLFQT
jgi:hypothetical protein